MIVQSDHGHSTEERAFLGGGSAGIYRGAKFSLFEGGIRVPAILSWPGHLPENEVRSQVAYGCDWLPTIAELCGAKLPDVTLDGKSLVAVIKDARGPVAARRPALANREELGRPRGRLEAAVRREDTTERSPGTVIRGEFLVNLKDDPSEKTNLAAERPEIVARLKRLRAEWEAWAEVAGTHRRRVSPSVTAHGSTGLTRGQECACYDWTSRSRRSRNLRSLSLVARASACS